MLGYVLGDFVTNSSGHPVDVSSHFCLEHSGSAKKQKIKNGITINVCGRPLGPGTDVMILKIFLQKKLAEKLAFLTENKAIF
jgi:hypothetical protein